MQWQAADVEENGASATRTVRTVKQRILRRESARTSRASHFYAHLYL